MLSSKKVLATLSPVLLILLGFLIINFYYGVPGGIAMILGLTILIDRVLPEQKTN